MIIYTFRTFPYVRDFEERFGEVFVFSELKKDIVHFNTILTTEPERVVGIALTNGVTRQEPVAINRFNNGKILKDGDDILSITLLDGFNLASKPTHTFCNWTMYHIQNFINEQNLRTKFSFIHINKNDLGLISDLEG